MSECVVRMEMPQGCEDCPFRDFLFCCCVKGRKYAGSSPVRPNWCPIICQLPEGHGRLVDAEEMYNKSEAFCNQCRQGEHDCEKCNYIVAQGYMYKTPTIVPAERRANDGTD